MKLRPCKGVPGAWCGHLRVPFDRQDPRAGTIPIGFEWYPAASGRAAGTIVAMEGGPGYPSTGSRDDYLELFAPLLGSRNLLLVDNRGTGTSGLVNCRPLQRWRAADGNPDYLRRVAACGRQLNHTRALPGGGFVHGSDLYGTATWDLDSGKVTASVHVKGPKGAAASLRMAWNDKGRHPSATVTGQALGDRLAATLPAP